MGLDASTSCIGLAVLDFQDGQISVVTIEYFSPNKKLDILDKLLQVKNFIIEKLNQYKPDEVALEDIIKFMQGKSTAQTISSLASLNRTVGLTVLEKTGKKPELFNVLTIRHAIKEGKGKKIPAKEDVPARLEQILNIKFPYIMKKKRNGTMEIAVQSYDLADGLACAYTYVKKKLLDKPKK
jgi:Holliday junction resolvasome RuvABC endonuclease subunit